MAMFNCPKCLKTIGELPESGALIALCTDCQFKYLAIRGKLLERNSTAPRGHRDNPTRRYLLKLELPNRQTEITEFDQKGLVEVAHARRTDDIVIVYSMRGAKREELLAVHNLTSGESYALSAPGQKSESASDAWGAFAGLAVGSLSLVAVPLVPALLIGLFTAIGTGVMLRRRLAPVHVLDADALERLERKHSWLSEKLRLEEARARVECDIEDRERVRRRLVDLRRKMLEVGLDAYKPRLASIDVALATLDKQMVLDKSLHDGYDRSIKMIEIEQEASSADEIIPDDLTPIVFEKLDELKALEEKQAELARELEANAEIEQLLRSGRMTT
jgi:hypothetical protein